MRLGLVRRIRLNLTQRDLEGIAQDAKKRGLFDEAAEIAKSIQNADERNAFMSELIAPVLMAEWYRAYEGTIVRELQNIPQRDWGAFFDSILRFLEGLIPILMILIDLFT